jgi:pseudouridine-5'-phosphate glycosidase/pseudouridine kinase
MMVVCAGAKSILDIALTLEVLETQGVCVAAFGPKDDFPAFYSPSSGCKAPWRVGSVQEAAEIVCE